MNIWFDHVNGVLGLLCKLLFVDQGYEQNWVVKADDISYKLVSAAAVSQINDLGSLLLNQIKLLIRSDFVAFIDLIKELISNGYFLIEQIWIQRDNAWLKP